MELFRYIPLFFFLLTYKKYKIEYIPLCRILFVYAGIDFFVSILQTLNVGVVNFISRLYASDLHIQNSLGLSLRAIGLSRGPGDHGAIMVVLFVFFFSNCFYKYSKLNLWGCLLTLITILLSQSQTSFIAMMFAIFVILFYYFLLGRKNQKYKSIKLGVLLTVCGVFFVNYFFKNLRYLYTLIERGTDRSSFQLRLEKTDFIISEIKKDPILSIIGFGKDYWGELSSAMDNEYLYIFAVYGLVIFILAIFFVILHLYRGFFLQSVFINKGLYFVIVAGLVIAYPTSFFTEPRIIILLVFLSLLTENNFFVNPKHKFMRINRYE